MVVVKKKEKTIVGWSGGKDSSATILLAYEKGIPIDEILYSEVIFDRMEDGTEISGELPEHKDFIYNRAIPKLESFGYKVTVVKSQTTYMDMFMKIRQRGKREGKIYGFPMSMGCWANSDLKMPPIHAFYKSITEDVVQIVGIAADEPERLDQIDGIHKRSLLVEYNIKESETYSLCSKYDMLSPIYEHFQRNGCWFCPNQSYTQLEYLRKHHPELWQRLLDLQKLSEFPFRIGEPMEKIEHRFYWEEQQIDLFRDFSLQ